MRRTAWFIGLGWLLAGWTWGELSVTAFAQNEQTPAATTEAAPAAPAPELPVDYVKAVEAFMAGDGKNMTELVATALRTGGRALTPEHRRLLTEMRREAPAFDPTWWPSVRSSSNVSFKADMWKKRFTANYMPSETLGVQAPVGIDPATNRLQVIVSWRPSMVDSPKPLEGWLAKSHGMTQANLAEVIVWHELGHNYITLHLPIPQVMDLYQNHGMLYSHVQEFYADLTALRHCAPPAARTTLMFRLRELYDYHDSEPHTRAAHGLAALMLVEWMQNPDKWPMIHFPPTVPQTNVELETIKYVYEHMDPKWSVEEYFGLHDFIDKWVVRNGDRVLKGRGQIRLPNNLQMMIMVSDDREDQAKRDQWIATRLQEIIKAGRADKPVEPEKKETVVIMRDGKRIEIERESSNYWDGIEIPW